MKATQLKYALNTNGFIAITFLGGRGLKLKVLF